MIEHLVFNEAYQTRSSYEIEMNMRNRQNHMAIQNPREDTEELQNLRWKVDPFKSLLTSFFAHS